MSRFALEKLSSHAIPWESQILDESSFHKMIDLEQKRTGRTGTAFVLMRIDFGAGAEARNRHGALRQALAALARATRETDIKGWHTHGLAIGVIFTEIGASEGSAVARTLMARVSAVLSSVLSREDNHEIRTSVRIFPEAPGRSGDLAQSGFDRRDFGGAGDRQLPERVSRR